MKDLNEAIICAGFGGQGIMTLGKVLANAGMLQGYNVTWFPSYGAEVRGGTAHAMVRISSEPVSSPLVRRADTAFIMNGPSLKKFNKRIRPGGLLILNSSLVREKEDGDAFNVIKAPLTSEALSLGNVRVANMIAAGIYASVKGVLDKNVLEEVIGLMAGARKDIIPVNTEALLRGIEIGEKYEQKDKRIK